MRSLLLLPLLPPKLSQPQHKAVVVVNRIPFSELTDEQRARAAYLFADVHFGTNPDAYEYTLSGADVTGRVKRVRGRHVGRAVNPQVIVMRAPEENITEDIAASARGSLIRMANDYVAEMMKVNA